MYSSYNRRRKVHSSPDNGINSSFEDSPRLSSSNKSENMFLFGGSYYRRNPKYHKRKRRGLELRSFLFSPLRVSILAMLLFLLVVYNKRGQRNLFHSFTYDRKIFVLKRPDYVSSYPSISVEQRLSVLEEIIPVWFHRNDVPLRTLANSPTHASQSYCKDGTLPSLSVTLVIQTSPDRLFLIVETCRRWKDPILVVVYLPRSSTLQKQPDFLSTCTHVTLIPFTPLSSTSIKEDYPINQLRNAGLDHVQSSHVLLIDIDFLPSINLDKQLRLILTQLQETTLVDSHPTALVIPAYECKKNLQPSNVPSNIHELHTCYFQEKHCIVFQGDVNWEGHSSTRSESWLAQQIHHAPEETQLLPIPCFDSPRYEPYIVVPWCVNTTSTPKSPYYDERFHGYGKNKIQYISHLRFLGYQFHILPQGFIIHYPHEPSKIKEIWNRKDEFDLHEKMDQLYPQFLQELNQAYPATMGRQKVPFCISTSR